MLLIQFTRTLRLCHFHQKSLIAAIAKARCHAGQISRVLSSNSSVLQHRTVSLQDASRHDTALAGNTHRSAGALLNVQRTAIRQDRCYAKKGKKEKGGKGSKAQAVQLSTEELEGLLDVDDMKSDMQRVLDELRNEYIQHLSLRTSAGVFDNLVVETDDGKFPLNQLGQIVQKNPSLIIINMTLMPQCIPAVKDAIIKSGLNINPQQEANTLFVAIPKVTKEHREGLAKSAKTLCDKTKEKLRDLHNRHTKKLKQAKNTHSEDLIRNAQELVLTTMHDFTTQADGMMQAKQKELLGTGK